MSDGYIKNSAYELSSGLSRPVPSGTGAQLDAMIEQGTLKNGDSCICTDDYDSSSVGNTDISSIGDGTLTGAISSLNQNITNLDKIKASIHTSRVVDNGQLTEGSTEYVEHSYTIQSDGWYFCTLYNGSVNQNVLIIRLNGCNVNVNYGDQYIRANARLWCNVGDVITFASKKTSAYQVDLQS